MEEPKSNAPLLLGMIFVAITLAIGLGIFLVQKNEQDSSKSTEKTATETPKKIVTPTEETIVEDTESPAVVEESDSDVFTSSTLANFNGQDGNSCYVALDGIVYDVTASRLWVDGVHTTSGGRAKCGEDLTEVISQSPHGDSVLDRSVVVEVGTYSN